MRYFIYTEEGDKRKLEEVDSDGLGAVLDATHLGIHCIEQAVFDEGRTNGESHSMTYFTLKPLDMQGKIILYTDCVGYFDLLQPGGRIWMSKK